MMESQIYSAIQVKFVLDILVFVALGHIEGEAVCYIHTVRTSGTDVSDCVNYEAIDHKG